MSRVVFIDGEICKVVEMSDVAPNGIEELRELCRGTGGFLSEPCEVHPMPKGPSDDVSENDSRSDLDRLSGQQRRERGA